MNWMGIDDDATEIVWSRRQSQQPSSTLSHVLCTSANVESETETKKKKTKRPKGIRKWTDTHTKQSLRVFMDCTRSLVINLHTRIVCMLLVFFSASPPHRLISRRRNALGAFYHRRICSAFIKYAQHTPYTHTDTTDTADTHADKHQLGNQEC